MRGKIKLISYFVILFFLIFQLAIPYTTEAAVTKVVLRLDRHSASVAPSGTACILTTTAGTETSLAITFPSSFTIDTTTSTWTMDTTSSNILIGQTEWSGTTSGTASSAVGQVVTFPVGDVGANGFTCMHFTATGTNSTGTSGNDKTGSIATNIDSATPYATSIVSSNADQISVTASVASTFTFSLGSNTAALGALSTSSVTSATGISASVSTNARLGWSMWVRNSTNGLYSTTGSTAVPPAGTYGSTFDLSGTTGYGLDVNSGSGTPTIDAAYDGTADTNYVGTLTSSLKPIATKATPGTSDAVTLRFRAKVGATQAAASDYTDTVTVVAAGNF